MSYSYFSYGSCMNQQDLLRTTPSARNPRLLVLPNWHLRFNIYAPGRNGGVANIEPGEGFVEGVLWEVDELDSLRVREGCPYVYQEHELETPNGLATTFIATHGDDDDYRPSKEYLNLILNPAVPHSAHYQARLLEALSWPKSAPLSPAWKLVLPHEPETHLTFHNPLEAVGVARMSEKIYDKPVQLIHLPSGTKYLID